MKNMKWFGTLGSAQDQEEEHHQDWYRHREKEKNFCSAAARLSFEME